MLVLVFSVFLHGNTVCQSITCVFHCMRANCWLYQTGQATDRTSYIISPREDTVLCHKIIIRYCACLEIIFTVLPKYVFCLYAGLLASHGQLSTEFWFIWILKNNCHEYHVMVRLQPHWFWILKYVNVIYFINFDHTSWYIVLS
jgi:hypothetical protein